MVTSLPPLFPLSLQEEIHNNVEVVHTYRQHILNDMNPSNLHLFISAYNR
jgi:protein NDRG1